VSRYMPRRGYPPTQTWRTFLRDQGFAIGTIGLGEGSAIGRASCSRPRMDRASCPVRYNGARWQPLRVYRAIIDLAPGAAISLFQSY